MYLLKFICEFSLIGAGVMAYFIPKIHQRTDKSNNDGDRCEPRASVLSLR